MINREKVIKGFECCHVMVHDLGPDKTSCGICPYKDVQTEEQIDLGGIECIAVLHDDALALLKEEYSPEREIVRCKDCDHRGKVEKCVLAAIAAEKGYPLFMLDNRGEWFCADGRRAVK